MLCRRWLVFLLIVLLFTSFTLGTAAAIGRQKGKNDAPTETEVLESQADTTIETSETEVSGSRQKGKDDVPTETEVLESEVDTTIDTSETEVPGSRQKGKNDAPTETEVPESEADTTSETTDISDGKTIQISVTVEGLLTGEEALLTLYKPAKGDEPGLTLKESTVGHIAVFQVPFGGTCTVTGGDVSGYISPEPIGFTLTQLKGNFLLSGEITYTLSEENIPVTGVELNPISLFLLKGTSASINAYIVPGNATNQEVTWSTENDSVASVSNGMVFGTDSGETEIHATTVDGGYIGTCDVLVAEIVALGTLDDITTEIGTAVSLPDQVEADLTTGGPINVDVLWQGAYTVGGVQRVSFDTAGTHEVLGDVEGTDLTAKINIVVQGSGDVVDPEPEDVTLDPNSMGLFVGTSDTLTAIVTEGMNTGSLVWVSSNTEIATVSPITGLTTTVTGQSIGTTTIHLKSYDGTILATCLISVSINPVPPEDEVMILATSETSPEKVDEFVLREDVYIRGFNMQATTYYIRIEDKGSGPLLGKGEIDLTGYSFDGNQVVFNLYEAVPFDYTDNYSNEYFVYLSLDPSFPMGDDEFGVPRTLMTNFRVGSPVPTASIVVNIWEMVDGEFVNTISDDLVGRDVVLAREIDDVAPIDVNISHYLNPLYESEDETIPIELRTSKYNDEVKLVGHITADGTVDWDVPKEKLKIGGYYLLIELPDGYTSNLDIYDPYTDDGGLVKEVHITRNVVTVRDVYVINP